MACGAAGSPDGRPAEAVPSADAAADWFTDQAEATGLDFVHFNGMSGRFYQPEIMAPGVALFDYDNDGDLDVYLVQGRMLGTGTTAAAACPQDSSRIACIATTSSMHADGTARAAIHRRDRGERHRTRGYGMGVATGDIDNDGRRRSLRHRVRPESDCFATTATARSRTSRPRAAPATRGRGASRRPSSISIATAGSISSSATTCATASRRTSTVSASRPARLLPAERLPRAAEPALSQPGAREVRRRHDCVGTRAAVRSGARRLDRRLQRRRLDRHLRRQRRGRRTSSGSTSATAHSRNTALVAGAALGASGERKANMGVDAGDFDADGDEDLFITELIGQGSTLYVNDGTGVFEEQSARTGHPPGQPAVHRLRRGVARRRQRRLARSARRQRRRQPERRRAWRGPATRSRWASATSCCATSADGSRTSPPAPGGSFELVEASRGAAFGDVDNDGDIDVVVGNGAGRVRLLINEIGQRKHWIGLRLVGAGDDARETCSAPASASFDPNGRCSGGARAPTAATRRPTIRACSSVWATRRRRRASESYGLAGETRRVAGCRDRSVHDSAAGDGTVKMMLQARSVCRIVLAACVVVLAACDRASIHTSSRSRRSPCPTSRDYLRPFTSRFEIGSTPLRNHREHEHTAGRAAAAYGDMGRVFLAASAGRRGGSLFSPRAGARARGSGAGRTCLGHVYLLTGERSRAAASFERTLTLRPGDRRRSSGSARRAWMKAASVMPRPCS